MDQKLIYDTADKEKLIGQSLTGKDAVRMELYLTTIINMFFKFLADNKKDIDLQAERIAKLDERWRNWLKMRSSVYNYDVFEGRFLQQLNVLIPLRTRYLKHIEIIARGQDIDKVIGK